MYFVEFHPDVSEIITYISYLLLITVFFLICFNHFLTDQITNIIMVGTLVHPSNKPIDLVFPVASIFTFYKMGGLFLHSISWIRQFKGPQKVVCFFETFSSGIDLMNQILHADNAIISQEIKQTRRYLSGQFTSCWFYHNHTCRSIHLLTSDLGTPMQYMANTSWQIDGETMETMRDFYFLGLQNHCRWWLQPWN